ncbi:MAG: phosphodiester glycosidase family protein, partial [Bacteroidota bacterium]
ITGAMYDDVDNMPPGLVINKNNEIKSLNFNSGIEGNFYMQPNGVFYINKQDVGVVESNSFSNNNSYFAIQSGPMLIENSQIPSVVNPASVNKRKRCAVGVSGMGQNKVVYFVCSNNDVSFYDMASLFHDKYNCSDALHLESGVFPFIYWPGSNMRSKENIMNYIVIR